MAAKKNPSNELKITRIYDAPVKAVWNAWVDPDQVGKWWGPRGFTLTTKSKDVRTGGTWVYTMHGPDGVDYPNIATYLEVNEYSRLVYDHGATETTPPLFRVTVLFSEKNGKTTMDMTMTLPTPEAAAETAKFVKKAGGNATWDRLAEFLAKERAQKDIFVINRTFAAPIDLMYQMWTDPKHLLRWSGPTGSGMEYIRTDIRVGGSSFYWMTVPNQEKLYGLVQYLELRKPDRIVYTQQFVDENENVIRHPMAPTWPETMQTTIVLSDEGNGMTRVSLTWEPYGKVTREELEAFVAARTGMTGGWTGSFDKLEEYLEQNPG